MLLISIQNLLQNLSNDDKFKWEKVTREGVMPSYVRDTSNREKRPKEKRMNFSCTSRLFPFSFLWGQQRMSFSLRLIPGLYYTQFR